MNSSRHYANHRYLTPVATQNQTNTLGRKAKVEMSINGGKSD